MSALWQPISTAVCDGTVALLRFRDALGYYELTVPCFLHEDGYWYAIDPPKQLSGNPTHWRPQPI